ncbi:MAG: hypothetical protein JRD89_02580 [Deltaproteobacteria bacterium]|nr:hypothetical protein [Deltaproteobacteria bacterium]
MSARRSPARWPDPWRHIGTEAGTGACLDRQRSHRRSRGKTGLLRGSHGTGMGRR